MAPEARSAEAEQMASRTTSKTHAEEGKAKAGPAAAKDGLSSFADFPTTFDPQKFFSMTQMEKRDFEQLFETNIEMMRTFDKIFQAWAAGFSSRMQERIHTIEEIVKSESQVEAVSLQNECAQRLAKHWMTDNQKLTSMFFDALTKSVKDNSGWFSSTLKKGSERLTGA